MNPEEKKLLQETADLAKKNNKILRGMQRKQTIASIFSAIKWVIIIGFTIWSLYIIQPFLEQTLALYKQVQETTNTVNELKVKADGAFDSSGLRNLLDTFKINGQ